MICQLICFCYCDADHRDLHLLTPSCPTRRSSDLLNDETRGFLSTARLAQMKKGAILVNTARGAVVDEAAMIAALKSGQLGHAGLDVFDVEPLPAGHPLTALDNATLSAHSAFRTPEASDNLIQAALDHSRRIAKEGK